ncbi:uncharacterized protein BJ171DRAFT_484658 [Polychytrium aggregatum]|uniref:uncharacterized protein n=1 Tax=Polychytrium aggregatum TaxID=110093 RepID=UPI0022FE92B7|nr:uncharacterized protein BJ171DRAFT_484658 [Polychytrium aggregatum]KAI9209661.1 hypothetical protein BJ171DRAFT_484658 [Polychytrium aggregatum]
MTLTEEQSRTLQLILHPSATVSMVCCSGVLVVLFMKRLRKRRLSMLDRIVGFMTLMDLIANSVHNLGNIMADVPHGCLVFGTILQYVLLSGLLWSTCLAYQCFSVIALRFSLAKTEGNMVYYMCVSLGLPLVVVACINFLPTFGLNEPIMGLATTWCWINSDFGLYRMIFFFGPLWLLFLVNVLLYARVGWVIHKSSRISKLINASNIHNRKRHAIVDPPLVRYAIRTLLYMAGVVVVFIPVTAARIQNMISPNDPNFMLTCLLAFFGPLLGAFNSTAFFYIEFFSNLKSSDAEHPSLSSNKGLFGRNTHPSPEPAPSLDATVGSSDDITFADALKSVA